MPTDPWLPGQTPGTAYWIVDESTGDVLGHREQAGAALVALAGFLGCAVSSLTKRRSGQPGVARVTRRDDEGPWLIGKATALTALGFELVEHTG